VRIATTALITALMSMGATFAAVLLYLTTTQMQAFGVDAIVMAILFGYGLALYGFIGAGIVGALLSAVRPEMRMAFRALIFGVTLAPVGGALGYWAAYRAPHLSTSWATLLFALCWGAAGPVAALVTRRSPN
jgi:hypothetical protein